MSEAVTHAYPGVVRSPSFPDGVLVAALAVVLTLVEPATLAAFLAASIVVVLVWGFATLHYPTRIDLDGEGLAFHRYGRVHRFAWRDLTFVQVRRFAVKDRVLVRVKPSGALEGRYWIDDRIEGFDALVTSLESRAHR